MTMSKLNTAHASDQESYANQSTPEGGLGWEGHVHFSEDVPLWKRVLDTWPELRTGLSYSLIFASGVLLGGAIMAMASAKNHEDRS
ncbi:MAG TPA: hypothetical protein VLA60_14860 [Nitrospirales bacterium]|nr:hypothetical protein [Nitrospirales bacterium]